MARKTVVFSIAWEPEDLEKIEELRKNSAYRTMSLGTFIRFLATIALEDVKKRMEEK